jgi:hypothetical protein
MRGQEEVLKMPGIETNWSELDFGEIVERLEVGG